MVLWYTFLSLRELGEWMMEPLFSEEQLQNMSKENIIALMQSMQAHQKKQETEIHLLKEKMKERK